MNMEQFVALTSAFGALDRHERFRATTDESAISSSRIVPVWRGRVPTRKQERGDAEVVVAAAVDYERAQQLGPFIPVFLGQHSDQSCFAALYDPAAKLEGHPALAGLDLMDLRLAGNLLSPIDIDLLALARGMAHWHRHNAFCGKCGEGCRSEQLGHVLVCTNSHCNKRHYPRTDPAMMALITYQGKILLARKAQFPANFYSILAGFVEIGESLEQSVAREVLEEVGLPVTNVRYVDSQSWPFPSSLMLGFQMEALHDEIVLDEIELESAAFYDRDAIESGRIAIPPRYSLSNRLIQRCYLNG